MILHFPFHPVCFNTLPNDKRLDLSTLKTFADNKLQVIQMAKYVLDKIENMVGKEENAGTQTSLPIICAWIIT